MVDACAWTQLSSLLPIRWVDTDGERSITRVTRGDRRNPADLCTRGAIPGELLVA